MKYKKILLISLLLFSTSFFAKIRIIPIKLNGVPLTVDFVDVKANQTQVQIIDTIQLETTLTITNHLIFNVAYKDSDGAYVSIYRSMPLTVKDGDEIGIASPEGFNLVITVSEL
ncbi:MAG: hypothetical protein AMXMBFR12_02920 [Candidatus Babeliales bacterium]